MDSQTPILRHLTMLSPRKSSSGRAQPKPQIVAKEEHEQNTK